MMCIRAACVILSLRCEVFLTADTDYKFYELFMHISLFCNCYFTFYPVYKHKIYFGLAQYEISENDDE